MLEGGGVAIAAAAAVALIAAPCNKDIGLECCKPAQATAESSCSPAVLPRWNHAPFKDTLSSKVSYRDPFWCNRLLLFLPDAG
jgi:hypothetical protein